MTIPAVAGLVAVAALGGWTLERACAAHADAAGEAAARAAADSFAALVRDATDELAATLGSLAADGELTAALAARDPRRLLAIAGPTFHDLRLHDGISHWNYWEPEAAGTAARGLRNVVRIATPTLRGDVVERELLARVAREQAVVSGVELGTTGLALRVLAPVRDGPRVVGYVELGRDVSRLVAELRRRTGDELALVPSVASADVPDHGATLGVKEEGARTFARGAFPIRDAAGVKVAAIYVLRDVTGLAGRERAIRRRALGALALGVALVGLAIVVAQEWIVVRPRRRVPVRGDSGPGAPPPAA